MNNNQWKGRTLSLEFAVPKGSYESKIVKIVEHTNLDRENAILPKVLRDEKRQREEVKEKAEAEKKEYEEKNATKIKKSTRTFVNIVNQIFRKKPSNILLLSTTIKLSKIKSFYYYGINL